ncbi:hypothetical protein [Janthinobacterium sp. RB2R34]|uniref:hypothetical protein n=1 Tax=Janthinobacterium sp. RB2R34 TaxID=3424193 RepID=UPI003F21140D
MMGWIFHASDPMGGAAGEAYANTLKSPGMQPEHVLAREAIQNSVDAGTGAKVEVYFREISLTGAKKKTFVDAADLGAIEARNAALQFAPNCLISLNKSRTPLRLLYVDDYNAEGLSGDPHDKGSNFYRLLLSLGDRSKARTAHGTGGSYGFGKSVYSSSSAIQTIFAYTRFQGADGAERTRIFGCGYYPSHEFKGTMYSGRAWLGSVERKDDLGRVIVDPLENAQADELAEKLGFELRAEGQCGTSILIVDSDVNMELIMKGVEDWWWPRLIQNKLDVAIIEADGKEHIPRPKKNIALKPFIQAFEIATSVAEPAAGAQKRLKLNAFEGVPLGTGGLVVIPVDQTGTPVVPGDKCNSVALIRAPLMVVAYKQFSEASPPVAGAFLASDSEEIDLVLKKSEPPAHDRWDPDSINLRDDTGLAKRMVEAVISRLRHGLRRFQTEAAPPAPAKQKRLGQLERALGSYFKPQGFGNAAPPDGAPSPLHLEFSKQPSAEATPSGKLRLTSVFVVWLDDKHEEDEVPLRLRINCPVIEDDNEEGDDLKLEVKISGITATRLDAEGAVYRFLLSKHEKAKFTIISEEYDPAWTVRLRPDIDKDVA